MSIAPNTPSRSLLLSGLRCADIFCRWKLGWARRFTPSPRRGEGGVRGLRRFRIAPPEPPHPTFSSRSRIYPTSAMFRGEVGQARLRAGRRSEGPCVPKSDYASQSPRYVRTLVLSGEGIARAIFRVLAVIGWAGLAAAPAAAQALDKVTFGTNWVAEAEHGGFYQALADGTYKRYGLDVTIVPGGPNVNNRILLPVGRIDFFMSANTLQSFDAVEQNVPTLAVAAMFQKDPQVLIAHPGPGVEKFEDLKGLTLFISKEGIASYYQWLKSDFGFSEARVKPYTFNPQPFLADKNSAMQGYVTSEPYAVETQGGFRPKVFLLADHGFDTYSTLIETRRDLVEQKPDLVQRFVDASVTGWYNYIYGDNRSGNDLIKRGNPEMTDALLAFSVAKMKKYGIVDSGDTATLGIGAMTDARMKSFFDKMVRAGVVKGSIDLRRAYTLAFVNKRVGIELRPRN
jgi:NitT/TauT family transport system substrate-binding protein